MVDHEHSKYTKKSQSLSWSNCKKHRSDTVALGLPQLTMLPICENDSGTLLSGNIRGEANGYGRGLRLGSELSGRS